MKAIEVTAPREPGEADYIYFTNLLADGGAYREADGRVHLYWRTP